MPPLPLPLEKNSMKSDVWLLCGMATCKFFCSILDLMFRLVLYVFSKKMAKVLVNNSHINENTCGSLSNTIKRKISHILETAPTHATKYNKKRFCTSKYKYQRYICCWENWKIAYEHDSRVAWECGCENSITLWMLGRKLQVIMLISEFSFFPFFLSTYFHKVVNMNLFKF